MINRLKTTSNKIDWADLLTNLHEAKLSTADTAELTAVSPSFLRNIRGDLVAHPAAWDAAITLLDLHLRLSDKPVPFIDPDHDL